MSKRPFVQVDRPGRGRPGWGACQLLGEDDQRPDPGRVADLQLWVAVDEDVGDQGAQVLGGDHEMQVRRTGERPVAGPSVESDTAPGSTPEPFASSSVNRWARACGRAVLHIVETVLVTPRPDARVRHRVALGVGDGSFDQAGWPWRRRCRPDSTRGVVDEEGAERWLRWRPCRPRCSPRSSARGAEGVGEQHELLALVVGDVPDPGQEIDRVVPLLGETDVADEVVQVYSQRLHDSV